MKKQPLVSVIVPLFNYSKYIGDCIRSVQNQDYENYELIVIDDCSTDKSYKIAKRFENKQIKVIQTSINSGYSKAKNEGIIISQGELITCIDADDLMTKNSISCRVKAFLNSNAFMVHARAIDIKGDVKLADCYSMKKLRRTTPRVHAQTVMLKRCVHVKYGLYDENLRSRSDKEMWWRLIGRDGIGRKIKDLFIKQDVAFYRRHKKSMMTNRRKNPKLQKQLTKLLKQQYKMRVCQGITKQNTRFLEK